jgi:hypothetical protein
MWQQTMQINILLTMNNSSLMCPGNQDISFDMAAWLLTGQPRNMSTYPDRDKRFPSPVFRLALKPTHICIRSTVGIVKTKKKQSLSTVAFSVGMDLIEHAVSFHSCITCCHGNAFNKSLHSNKHVFTILLLLKPHFICNLCMYF